MINNPLDEDVKVRQGKGSKGKPYDDGKYEVFHFSPLNSAAFRTA
jgi:hypothetical protein